MTSVTPSSSHIHSSRIVSPARTGNVFQQKIVPDGHESVDTVTLNNIVYQNPKHQAKSDASDHSLLQALTKSNVLLSLPLKSKSHPFENHSGEDSVKFAADNHKSVDTRSGLSKILENLSLRPKKELLVSAETVDSKAKASPVKHRSPSPVLAPDTQEETQSTVRPLPIGKKQGTFSETAELKSSPVYRLGVSPQSASNGLPFRNMIGGRSPVQTEKTPLSTPPRAQSIPE